MEVEFRKHLPPYRSLVDPNAQYDYRTHSFVHFSQLDLNKVLLGYQLPKLPRSSLKMKYKLLLLDVSLRASMLTMKKPSVSQRQATTARPLRKVTPVPKPVPPTSFGDLPEEIQIFVFDLVDDTPSYQNCLFTSKTFYRLAKPYLFRRVAFSSSYRFAQFITYLRLNSALGSHVLEVDLSQLKPGNWELEAQLEEEQENLAETDIFEDALAIWAGWRDWKFAINPLYTLHPLPSTPLIRHALPLLASSYPPQKKHKFRRYFKRRKSLSKIEVAEEPRPMIGPQRHNHTSRRLHQSNHPQINKFLMNYSALKDVPVGYVVHLINLCPNLRSLNLGNLSLSTDYLITPKMSQKYQGFDIMNNYPKDMLEKIDKMYPMADSDLFFPAKLHKAAPLDHSSSVSSVFSMSTLSKPKYNSLLPPLPKLVRDISYLSKGDGMVFLSDLNLKSINNAHLETVSEAEILNRMVKRSISLETINLSSMIWINLRLVKSFIGDMLAADLKRKTVDGKECVVFKNNYFSPLEPLDSEEDEMEEDSTTNAKNMVLDLSNSGMNKNLRWARKIDLTTRNGRKLIHKILNDELLSTFDEFTLRERDRMGRPGENYFAPI